MTKIIFLDMDGVLSTRRAWMANVGLDHPDRWIDPICVRYLNILCHAAVAEVVISSSWRTIYDTRGEFWRILDRAGFAGRLHLDDWRTKRIHNPVGVGANRGDEVKEWLSRHPEITAHVILDDDSDFSADQPLVLTDPNIGLDQHTTKIALQRLLPEGWEAAWRRAIGLGEG